MQRLIVDMDGVLADAHAQFVAYDERDTKIRKTIAETIGVPELEAFARANEYVLTPGFFRGCAIDCRKPGSSGKVERPV
ncbi:MAG: hypothetical protein WDN00_14210 [Limisphaerales bacterium]